MHPHILNDFSAVPASSLWPCGGKRGPVPVPAVRQSPETSAGRGIQLKFTYFESLMSLSIEQLNQVAHLARLEMQPEQADHYAKQLSGILDLVSQLSQADTTGVEPMAHPLEMHQRLRPDVVTETDRRETFQANAPAVEDGLFIVPKVIE